MASIKSMYSAFSIAGLVATSLAISPSAFAQNYERSSRQQELAGAHHAERKGSAQRVSQNRKHNDHRNAGNRADRNDYRGDNRSNRNNNDRAYRNSDYDRQWQHADKNYNNHNSHDNRYKNNRNTRPPAVYQKHRTTPVYRSATHINGFYNPRSFRDRRFYGTRQHGHYHAGYDHLYCPNHSGTRYHIGGRYNRANTSIVISNYGRYGLHAPPRGHHWVRDRDNGDAILASVATGAIIGLVVGIIASEHDDHNDRYYRRY